MLIERRLEIRIIVLFLCAIFADKFKPWFFCGDLYWSPSRLIEARAVAPYGKVSNSAHFCVSEHKYSIRSFCAVIVCHRLCDV